MRPMRDEYFLEIAGVVATRGTCPRLKVGAVIVSEDGHVVSTGFNGSPRHIEHCIDVGCDVDAAEHCVRAVHAEANAIIQAAHSGHATKGAIIYCTHLPCRRCLGLIINAGIKEVVYINAYKMEPVVFALASEASIHLWQWCGDL